MPGAFYSVADNHNEGAARTGDPVPNLYFGFIKKQIAELHTKYPGLRVQIFGSSPRLSPEQWNDLVQLLHRVNPQCVIMDAKHEGVTQFGGGTVLKGWRWQPNAELVPAAQLFRLYDQTQAAKKSFFLTVGANPSGNIPDNQIAELLTLREMMATPPPRQTTVAPTAKPRSRRTVEKTEIPFRPGPHQQGRLRQESQRDRGFTVNRILHRLWNKFNLKIITMKKILVCLFIGFLADGVFHQATGPWLRLI